MWINNFLGNSQKILHTEILLKVFNIFRSFMLSLSSENLFQTHIWKKKLKDKS